jgi:hypothetical protein
MPTENPTDSQSNPTKEPVVFLLNQEPALQGLILKSEQQRVANSLREKSNNLISQAPTTQADKLFRITRAAELRGMIELISLMVEAGMQVPAMLEGIVLAELRRVSP